MRSRPSITLIPHGTPAAGRLLTLIAASALALAPWAAGPARAGFADEDLLEGVVLDVGGDPASGAAVVLAGHGDRKDTVADAGGRFRIEPVAPGVYRLSATAENIESAEIRIEVREGEAPPLVTLVLRPPQPVAFDVPVSFDVPASRPTAGRLEVILAGEYLLNHRFETGHMPAMTLGAPRTGSWPACV